MPSTLDVVALPSRIILNVTSAHNVLKDLEEEVTETMKCTDFLSGIKDPRLLETVNRCHGAIAMHHKPITSRGLAELELVVVDLAAILLEELDAAVEEDMVAVDARVEAMENSCHVYIPAIMKPLLGRTSLTLSVRKSMNSVRRRNERLLPLTLVSPNLFL
jgi:hypothetical protein